MSEIAEAVSDLRSVYGELFPQRNPEAMRISDDVLAAVVLIRREIRMSWSESFSMTGGPILHGQILDRLAAHTPNEQG